MAAIEVRTRQDGSRSFRLKWRYGGGRGGAPQSVTYADLADAKRMKGAVEALGHLVYAEDPRVQTFELVTGQRPTSYTAPTFGEVAERYILSRTRASAQTRDLYRFTVKSRLSALVNRPIEAITDDDIRQVINTITDSGGSATAAYEMTCSVFKFAVNKGMLPGGNPTVFVEAPKKRGRTANFLTVDEAQSLVDACRRDRSVAVGAALADLVVVILGTGLRISEALGLIVADVHVDDINAAWLDVDKQLARRTKKSPLPRRVPLKSSAAQRRVVLDGDTGRILARLIKGRSPGDPVFRNPVDGGWGRQHSINVAWDRARSLAQAAGLAKVPRVHDLRHTHAAWLLTDGVPLLAVSRRLGHESIKVTADVYGHLLPEADDTIREAITKRRGATGREPSRGPASRAATNTRPAAQRTRQRGAGRAATRKDRDTTA